MYSIHKHAAVSLCILVPSLLLMPSWGGAWVYDAITMCMGLDMAEALLAPKTNLHWHIICIMTINLFSFAKPFIVSAELMSYHIANMQSSSQKV